MSRGRRYLEECWCCGYPGWHGGRELCIRCYSRWVKRGFPGPGPGPSQKPPVIESAREYAQLITSMSARQAAERLGVTSRTIQRWRAALREAA